MIAKQNNITKCNTVNKLFLNITYLHFYNSFMNTVVEEMWCVAYDFFKFYVLTVYINSVHIIYAVPDDELIDSKHV
jgi:hypothetical protein